MLGIASQQLCLVLEIHCKYRIGLFDESRGEGLRPMFRERSPHLFGRGDALGSGRLPATACVPAEHAYTSRFASSIDLRKRALAMGLRMMFPKQTNRNDLALGRIWDLL